jgi:hypothetical protein
MGLMLTGLLTPAPSAEASGAAVCTISGTISFAPSSASQGVWRISPAVISCQGLFRGYERIVGGGSFSGFGSYTAQPGGSGTCLHHAGLGTVDYTIQTTETDVHIQEPHEFVLAGAGAFVTKTLKGTFQVTPPYEGDCVTKPMTKAFFVAQGVMVRTTPLAPNN